jgi:hypothetical protein
MHASSETRDHDVVHMHAHVVKLLGIHLLRNLEKVPSYLWYK